ncbi:MAG: diguanylate cyclase, partial [Chloroflexi bacterium]|nr:diguanylate cyclase [Chloroflexota bacterium]
SITHTPVETLRGQREITISLGVVELSEEITGLVSLVDHADAAMYQAKRAGRNRVVSAPENAASRLPATKLPQSNPGGMNR